MFAISFDMSISDLEQHYGKPYNRAYFEIKEVLKKNGFDWIQGSTYLTKSDDLGNLFRAIEALKKLNGSENQYVTLEAIRLKTGLTLRI